MSWQDEEYNRKKIKRYGNRRPYGAIDHVVIDSPAYASLRHSSVRLLNILTRQLTKDNNGHLQATYSYCGKRGFGSENTLRLGIDDLIDKGFIYRTRSRGANGVPSLYAVTWLSIVKKDKLYLHGFKKDLFLEVEVKNTIPKKVMKPSSSYCSFKRDSSSK